MRRSIKRQKAFLGESIAAAGIGAAATLAAAGISANASIKAGKQQADAAKDAAKRQAEALRQQNENANTLQQQSIEFTRQQNELNRELQKDAQMNIQLAMGQRTTEEARNQARIQVKKGGSTRRKLKNIGMSSQPFYGGANGDFPFTVTDGGGVIPINQDQNGTLYEIVGDNHDQSHSSYKGRQTGVGFKFANGEEIEGEGNGNTNNGELLYTTPNDALFISKHSINGYNPRLDVMSGTDPRLAFQRQEMAKSMQKHARRKVYEVGGDVIPNAGLMFNQGDELLNTNNAILALNQIKQDGVNLRSLAKCGKRIKADNGFGTGSLMWGAGINSLGNLGGALISMWGNNRAARRLSSAYDEAGKILSNAYGSLHTIDDNVLDKESFKASHVMPALQSTVVQNNADREALAREVRKSEERINNTTLSGAARQNRLAAMSDAYNQGLAQISQAENKEMRDRIEANMYAANAAAIKNAELDAQVNKDYTASRLALAQYNNDIVNQRITGAAQAQADAISGGAQARATALQLNGQALGSAIAASGNAFSTALTTDATNRSEYRKVLAGLDNDKKVSSVIQMGDRDTAKGLYDGWKNSSVEGLRDLANQLNDAFGFDTYRPKALAINNQTNNNTVSFGTPMFANSRMSLKITNPTNEFFARKYLNGYYINNPINLQDVVPNVVTTSSTDIQKLNNYYSNLYINK